METVCECICGGQKWFIYRDRMECAKCGKEYKWPIECDDSEATKAQDLVSLTNNNL